MFTIFFKINYFFLANMKFLCVFAAVVVAVLAQEEYEQIHPQVLIDRYVTRNSIE